MSSCSRQNTIILVPCYKAIEQGTMEALQELQNKGWTFEVRYGFSAIDGARALMASWALHRGYEYTFWIDSDQLFTYRDFQMVAEGPDKWACAPYMTKTQQGLIACLGEDIGPHTRGIKHIRAAGFGFMKVHRSIYSSMIDSGMVPTCQNSPNSQPFWPFFQPKVFEIEGYNKYYGEDYSFCLTAEKLGHKLWANFDTNVRHIGQYAYDWKRDSAGTAPVIQETRRLGGG